jgi:hypothetical protein
MTGPVRALQLLFNDVGFDWNHRQFYLSRVLDRDILLLDEITDEEMSLIMERLEEIKEARSQWKSAPTVENTST